MLVLTRCTNVDDTSIIKTGHGIEITVTDIQGHPSRPARRASRSEVYDELDNKA